MQVAAAMAAAAIGLLFVGVRYWLARTPALSETYYDEALTGLMAFEILRGIPQVFYWGEPYGGASGDAYPAAAGFWLFGASTLVLRMSAVAVAALAAWSAWSLGRRTAGEGFGLLAGLAAAVPPVFLSYVQLSSHGEGVAMAFGAVALAAAGRLVDRDADRRADRLLWVALGLAGGLGWWSSQIMGMLLIAAVLGVLVARPRVFREPGLYAALGLFTVASLPFWIWNLHHEWATFRHLLTWGAQPPVSLLSRVSVVTWTLVAALQDHFWDGHALQLSATGRAVAWVLIVAVYTPGVLVAAWCVGRWGRRLWRRERPWREPLDLLALAFWLTVAAHLATWFGTAGILRYSITFFATLPVLAAAALHRMWGTGRVGRVVAVTLAAGLLGYNALTHGLFVRQAAGAPQRPVDAAIARLTALGVRACYADSRIAQVLTFESRERIVCSEYYGFRNFALLQRVDAVDDPDAVAVVTHRVLQRPRLETLAETLRLMGAEARREEVGDYVIFHHVRPPDSSVRPIPASGWSARASVYGDRAALAFDRRVWTRWAAPSETDSAWLELDLGRVYRLAQLTLESAELDAPPGLLVETSLDEQLWKQAAWAPSLLSGVHWWKGHPRVDESGRVIVRLEPRPARYVRLIRPGPGRPGTDWSIAELFAYEAGDQLWVPPTPAEAAYAEATRELAHWMDDPVGPHPKRAPVTYEHRRAQVRWAAAFAAANRAIEVAPEWEDAHHLYRRALDLSGWTEDYDGSVARAQADGAWPEVVRWAELADAARPGFWHSGRDEARAQALDRLGRAAEAEAVRAAIARRSLPPAFARFGSELELTGMELPATARPGDQLAIRYGWHAFRRMRHDYSAVVQLEGAGWRLGQEHRLGGQYGTSVWAEGERMQESVIVLVPPDTPVGIYQVKVGVRLPWSGKRLRVTDTGLPRARQAIVVGSVTVTR